MHIDLNYNLTKDFNISLYLFKNFFLKDTNNFIIPDLIMCEKGNTKLLNCIEKIVTNVNEYNYGSDWSEVSNSKLITSKFNNSDLENMELILKDNKVYHDNDVIIDSIDEDYFTLKESNLDSWETKKIY